MKIIFFTLITCVLAISCEKEPGKGGTSSISGKVKVYDINGVGDTIDSYYGMDEDVFIVYGENDNTYDDKFSTSYDGSYRYDYLTIGTYTLFSYSRCDTCNDGMTAVLKVVEITENKTAYTVGDINILK